MPDVVHIEATGLGGRDIGFPERLDISIRTDPEGQNVYGPSLATVAGGSVPNLLLPLDSPRQPMNS